MHLKLIQRFDMNGENMNDVRISVIIPCYNCEKTVVETLDSLEFSAGLLHEVICINDGSIDGTYGILQKYAQRSQLNIKLIDGQNRGVSVARNKGIESADGDVLLFLDSDDKYSPLFFEEIKKHHGDYDTVYGYFTRDENELGSPSGESYFEKDIVDIQSEFMINKERCHTAAFSYNKRIIDECALRFVEGAKYGEDWEFTTKYLSLCRNGLCLNKRIFFYRDSDASVIKCPTYAHVHAIEAAIRTESFLKENERVFYNEFSRYMRHRAVFSVAHNFSKFGRKDLFDRLKSDYEVKDSMRFLIKNDCVGLKVRLAAFSYILSDKIFFYLVGRI